MWEILKSQDKQRVLDASVAGMRKQQWRQSMDGAACAYKASDFEGGCGIGCFLTEEEKDVIVSMNLNRGSIIGVYCSIVNSRPLEHQEDEDKRWIAFLQEVQLAHDSWLYADDRINSFQALAARHGLIYPEDPNGEDNV